MKGVKKLRKKDNKEFTLIEMIIVIVIIAILIALFVPNLQKFLSSAKQTKADAAAKRLYTAASTYLADKHTQGLPINPANQTWSEGENTSTVTKNTNLKEIMDNYFNENEGKDGASYEIHFDEKGDIKYVKWSEDGFTGKYSRNTSKVSPSPTT